jgi:Ca2+/H+ antiporter
VYNATIYINFNNTIALDSLKLVTMFNVIKIYTFILFLVQGIHQHATHKTEQAAQPINTAKPQQKDRTKHNVKLLIIIMTFAK